MKFNAFPGNADVLWQVCPRFADASQITQVKAWRKNPNANMIYILVLGAGGDGGPGQADGVSGFGGGGSGGQTSLLIPALLVPDVLYVSEFANTDASSGLMGVFVHPRATTLALWRSACVAYANIGSTSTGSLGGAAGAIATAANMPRGFGGIVAVLAGQAGANGGSSAVGGSIAYPTTGLLSTGGAGGGGGSNAGGGITASTPRPGIPGMVTGGFYYNGVGGINYVDGALLPTGGPGGCGTAAGNDFGGYGGSGGFGGGGGGGGSAGNGGTPAIGGLGGPGLIVIAQW